MNFVAAFKYSVVQRGFRRSVILVALAILLSSMPSLAQGTVTFNFNGLPSGTRQQYTSYFESGMQFGVFYGPGNIYVSGGGNSGYPHNGTGYLEMPDGNTSPLTFGYNVFPQSSTLTLFNLLSFDAAEFGNLGSGSLMFVGYKPMSGMVTNMFVLDGINDGLGSLQDFQSFNLDSQFANVYRVDVFGLGSLDNLSISGVPEPSTGALMLLAFVSFIMSRGIRKRQS